MENMKTILMVSFIFILVFCASIVGSAEEIAPLEGRITSYLARVMDTNSMQIRHDSQLYFAEEFLADTEYAGIPLVSQVAPQAAGREDDGGPEFYIDIDREYLTEDDLNLIAFFSDNIVFMKMSGAELLEWMEAATANFNQIDPESTQDQFLVDEEYRDYNFDQFDGVNYVIDVTKPVGERIVEAHYNGESLVDLEEVIVITNDFRAGGGGDFPNAVEENHILSSEVNNREYIGEYLNIVDGQVPDATHNWYIKPVEAQGQILFRSSPEASDYITSYEMIDQVGSFGGWGIYSYDLSISPIQD